MVEEEESTIKFDLPIADIEGDSQWKTFLSYHFQLLMVYQ